MKGILEEVNWLHVTTPLTLCSWMVGLIFCKLLFHRNKQLAKHFPESSLLIILGLVVGFVVDLIYLREVYLSPDLFFLYMLPPIALDAGYFMPNSAFVQNIGTIMLYAVFGTIFNIVTIGGTIYLFQFMYTVKLRFFELMMFSTLISAVDPVAVLSVFEEIHVNHVLYICVFGESLLNDAVTIVLYHSFNSMAKIGVGNIQYRDIGDAVISFTMVSTGGCILGAVFAFATALATKYSYNIQFVQPMVVFLLPFLSYWIAESVHLSGILAIVTCGLMMKPYLDGNLKPESLTTVRFFMKTVSSSSEALIFVLLGVSTFSKNHAWDLALSIVTVSACILWRFVGIYVLTWLANRNRTHKIEMLDQIIMGYGGLRGAICYGLVMSLDREMCPSKQVLTSTTIAVIIVTVFIQGTTIKPLVKCLGVKTEEPHIKTVTERVFCNCRDEMMACIDAIVGLRGLNYWRRRVLVLNRKYLQPFFMRNPQTIASKLLDRYSAVTAEEAKRKLLDQFGV